MNRGYYIFLYLLIHLNIDYAAQSTFQPSCVTFERLYGTSVNTNDLLCRGQLNHILSNSNLGSSSDIMNTVKHTYCPN